MEIGGICLEWKEISFALVKRKKKQNKTLKVVKDFFFRKVILKLHFYGTLK